MGAYEEGREAFNRGDDIDMNPYDERDAQWDEWEDGYAEAWRVVAVAGSLHN